MPKITSESIRLKLGGQASVHPIGGHDMGAAPSVDLVKCAYERVTTTA